jgi:hypothetical protein
MASKKDLKKDVKKLVNDVMDECDYIIITGGKNADAAEKLIDEVVEWYHTVIPKIISAKNKKDFGGLRDDIVKKGEDFVKKINSL